MIDLCTRFGLGVICLGVLLATGSPVGAVMIDFEEPEATAYTLLPSASPLRNDYAALGILFDESNAAPGVDAGGWILNTQLTSLAHSGTHVLQFNPGATYSQAPYAGQNVDGQQVIRFTTPAASVSFWVLWGDNAEPSDADFVVNAYHEGAGNLGQDLVVDAANVDGPEDAQWFQMTVTADLGAGEQIDFIEFTASNRQNFAFHKIDDLNVTFVPEPASAAILLAAGMMLVRRRR